MMRRCSNDEEMFKNVHGTVEVNDRPPPPPPPPTSKEQVKPPPLPTAIKQEAPSIDNIVSDGWGDGRLSGGNNTPGSISTTTLPNLEENETISDDPPAPINTTTTTPIVMNRNNMIPNPISSTAAAITIATIF